jgi:hypothetical protein
VVQENTLGLDLFLEHTVPHAEKIIFHCILRIAEVFSRLYTEKTEHTIISVENRNYAPIEKIKLFF